MTAKTKTKHSDLKKGGGAKDLKRLFSKDIQMDNMYKKRCSTLLIIREMQVKTIMRSYLTLIRMAIFEMPRDNNASEGVEEMKV